MSREVRGLLVIAFLAAAVYFLIGTPIGMSGGSTSFVGCLSLPRDIDVAGCIRIRTGQLALTGGAIVAAGWLFWTGRAAPR